MREVILPRLGTFERWRQVARALVAARVAADQVVWRLEGAMPTLFAQPDHALPDPVREVRVPKAFVGLARQICASRAPEAFDVAYQLLLRVADTPGLLSNRADVTVARAEALAKHIRRDMHKMKAFVRFREVTPTGANRRQFVSWFEPDHRIEELTAGFFARRFADMDWVIVTPEVTTRFEGGKVSHVAQANERLDLSDATEALWQTYYANIFNPARLKIKAMQSEMPKKYWKNLPEAALIPGLIAQAEDKVRKMREAQPTVAPVRAGKILKRLDPDKGA